MSKLVELTTKSQKEADFLSPMIIKEILFYLLNDEGSGAILREFVAKGTTTNSVALAIERVKNSFSEPINIANLSRELKVSEATLYNGFKKVLGFSPIQFQKMLRLEEARRLLQSRELKVNEVAFRVGYESPSQFSREYSRMYGVAPSSCRV